MPSVLIVDDEANIRRMLRGLLEAEGYRVTEAEDGGAGVERVVTEDPDVVLMDLAMPRTDGLTALRRLAERRPEVPVVMMSGRATLKDAVEATRLGAFHFIEKPLAPEAVVATVNGAVELRRARALSGRPVTLEDIIGPSAGMAAVRERIRQTSPTDARVLVTGESGTGKELVAAAIHHLSRRARGPFVRVNSAAIPRELVESEMFGHEKGAFTGATARRRGRFELADGGTLFLDEVADLSAEAQAKLLRALEAGTIERVGGGQPIAVDVRVVAATNRHLQDAMAAGRFRSDLYYRLNVVPIHIPPLRDRMEDLGPLVEHLVERLRTVQGLKPPRLDAAALAALARYPWPGNVRELGNICERLAILHGGGVADEAAVAALLPPMAGAADAPLAARLDAFERREIERALGAARGNIAEAARALQTDRPNLYRRMKRLGIER
ncbi:MAG TPA: sigma-54 dependent transcriptional regulator [Longimicrobiales bacterium]|nr:sigma-54 dependent transcriptional regulator [Longimicrobiales bacterium]